MTKNKEKEHKPASKSSDYLLDKGIISALHILDTERNACFVLSCTVDARSTVVNRELCLFSTVDEILHIAGAVLTGHFDIHDHLETQGLVVELQCYERKEMTKVEKGRKKG